jgi:hypothetical protein
MVDEMRRVLGKAQQFQGVDVKLDKSSDAPVRCISLNDS